MQLHYTTLWRESNGLEPALMIEDLDENIYKPAAEVDILPEAIDRILRQYLRCTLTHSSSVKTCYTSCVGKILAEEGVAALTAKLCWDWCYFGRRLQISFGGSDVNAGFVSAKLVNARLVPLRKAVVEVTRTHVPEGHIWRGILEKQASRTAKEEWEQKTICED